MRKTHSLTVFFPKEGCFEAGISRQQLEVQHFNVSIGMKLSVKTGEKTREGVLMARPFAFFYTVKFEDDSEKVLTQEDICAMSHSVPIRIQKLNK